MFINKKFTSALVFISATGTSFLANGAPSAEVLLQGVITNTTCDVTINGGKSTLNVGVYKSIDFTSANTQVGSVPLNVTLSNCTVDESGNLVIQGVTSTASNNKNLFVNVDTDTVGFMIKNAVGTQVTANAGTPVSATQGTPTAYNFQVGMGSTTVSPAAGTFSAPVVVAYMVN